jgi:hypothetical protein
MHDEHQWTRIPRTRSVTHWGVEMARKGGVPADWVINAMGRSAFAAWLKHRDRSLPSSRNLAVDPLPVDLASELQQLVFHVDDLLDPCPKTD